MLRKVKGWSIAKKAIGGVVLLLVVFTIIDTATPHSRPQKTVVLSTQQTGGRVQGDSTISKPQITTKTASETRPIPYQSVTQNDGTLQKGQTKLMTRGVDGVETLTYGITYTDGRQTDKKLLSQVVTTPAVNQVTAVGTYVAPAPAPAPKPKANCDPNYAGACVPIASDVDCAGGSGDGPAYVRGPVQVIGTDIYGLDRDKDGIGCE